jgi:hypothetical protein
MVEIAPLANIKAICSGCCKRIAGQERSSKETFRFFPYVGFSRHFFFMLCVGLFVQVVELQSNESEISIQFGIDRAATDTTFILKRATNLDGGNFEEM